MNTLLFVLFLFISGWACALMRAPLKAWSVIGLLSLLVAPYFLPPVMIAIFALPIAFAAMMSFEPLRLRLLSGPVMAMIRRNLPRMSQTEKEALEAGTVRWDAELFSGKPDWEKFFDEPVAELSADERAFLEGPVEQLCAMLDDWRITEIDHDLPEEVWQFIKDEGFFGLIIPREYGGLGFSAMAHSEVVMKIASRSISAAVTVMVPNSLGPGELLLHYGTREQKRHYLPRLARGLDVPCFALTAPDAGSDAAAMHDYGVVCRGEFEGEAIIGIRLNWRKRYITLGPVATLLGLAFKLYDPDQLLGEKTEYGISCALIPTDTAGVQIGQRHAPLNQSFMNGPNEGHDVFIPLDWLIGGVECAGQGWRMLMESLAAGRAISLPALSTGGGKLVSRSVGAYGRIRTQFNTSIGRFEGVEEALARIGGNTYLMEAARRMTCGYVDDGEKPSLLSAVVKYHLTERMRSVVNDGMDILGGRGICMGPQNFLARVYEAVPISITVEGANILTRNLIIFGQGALRCHPFLLDEMEAVHADDLKGFDRILRRHSAHVLTNAAYALFHGLTGSILAPHPSGPTWRYAQHLGRMSHVLALAADATLLLLGGSLKRRERLSARLGDLLSQLYLSSAVLKRFDSEDMPRADLPLVRWALDDSLQQMQESINGLLHNLPARPLAWLLRLLIFPWGRRFTGPSDALSHHVAALLLSPSETRERLTDGIYLPSEADEPLAILEEALRRTISAEPIEKRLSQGLKKAGIDLPEDEERIAWALDHGLVSEHEVVQLRAAWAARAAATAVDDFDPDYWRKEVCHGTESAA